MKNHKQIVRLTILALFAAIIMLTTMLSVPSGLGGYIHAGDAIIYACAWFLGPIAAVAAAIGSALSDLILGYVIYIPATLIIKGIMGLVVGILIKNLPQKTIHRVLAMASGAIIMIAGYFAFELFFFDISVALLSIPWNLVQAVVGIILGTLLIEALKKVNGINNLKEKSKSNK